MVTVEDHSNSEYSQNIRRICSRTLDLPPSCLEFLPSGSSSRKTIENPHDYFVVGTYHLQTSSTEVTSSDNIAADDEDEEPIPSAPKPQERDGSLSLFRFRDEKLDLIDKIPFPAGILDLHFLLGRQTFAVASSVGTISFYDFQTQVPSAGSPANLTFHHIATHQVFSASELVLSITFIPNNPSLLLATLNTGEVYLIHFPSSDFSTYTLLNDELPLSTHGAEAWISAVCPTLQHIYTGGDDAELRIHDIHLQEVPTSDLSITLSSKPRGHDAGVTAILPLPGLKDRMFFTGSYDDHVRLYAIQPNGYAKLITEKYLGGGVWRLKLLDEEKLEDRPKFRLLASCMHAGAKILEVAHHGEEWSIEEVAWNKEHKSMNYASDVQRLVDGDQNSKRICVSSSFYDKLLVVWEFDPLVKATSQ